MKERLLRVAKWLAFPAFYLFCLGLFGYLSFPYDRLKDRIVLEIEKRGKPGQRIEVEKLTSYWFTGVELSGVKLHLPPDDAAMPGTDFGASAPAKESVLTIDEAHARVRILPLLIGRVRVDFWVSAFGGEIKGTAPIGSGKGDVELELSNVELGRIEPIAQTLGVPIKGTLSGKLALNAPDGKFNKANGTVDFTIAGCTVSDGKTKIQGLIELPQAKLGDVTLSAEAKDGILKVNKLSANGTDLELVGDGKVTLKEPFTDAVADLYMRFKFTDAYRGKSATTKTLLGDPGSASAGLIEMQMPKMKRAKRGDGFYGWHVYGALKKLKFDPSTADGASSAGAAPPTKRGKGGDAPFGGLNKRPTMPALPVGGSAAKGAEDIMPPPAVPAAPAPDRGREPAAEAPRRAAAAPDVVPPPTFQPPPAPEPAPPAPAPEQQPMPDQPAPPPDQPAP
ncbi:General secretion pathway protein N [Minicystis rosea]|nr:General secretion pathway protein N [Minicystis rosea]